MSTAGHHEAHHGYDPTPFEASGVVDPARRRSELIPELPREREFDEAWWGTDKSIRKRTRRHADGPSRPIWRFVLATMLIAVGVVILGLSWWTQS